MEAFLRSRIAPSRLAFSSCLLVGRLSVSFPVPEDSVTNCTFGGLELKSLYITAGTALWRIDLNARGLAPHSAN
jgi:sugar lactone lactonase YvrE